MHCQLKKAFFKSMIIAKGPKKFLTTPIHLRG